MSDAGKATFSGPIEVAPDQNVLSFIGKVAIGDTYGTNLACFSHYNYHSTSSYALMQDSSGQTNINTASGKNILFRQNNSTKMTMNGSGLVFAGGSKVNLPYTGSNWGQIGRDVQNGGGGIEFRWASGNGDYICMHNFVNINHTSTSQTSFRLDVNGKINAVDGYSGSDDRIKYNEINISNTEGLSVIKKLQPQKYEKLIEFQMINQGHGYP